MREFVRSKNFALAIIGLALLVIMAGMFCFMYHELNNNTENTTTVEFLMNEDATAATTPTTDEEDDNADDAAESILLVDASGSMPEIDENKYMKQYHYDELKYFGDTVEDNATDCKNESRIGTALHMMLEEGYDRIGILTDLETYPAGDLEKLVGEYDEREIRFIYTSNYKQGNMNNVNKAVTGVLDPDTCTLIFVDENGEEQAIINNYVEEPETEPVTEPVVATPGNVKVVTTGASGNNAMFIMMLLMMFALATFAIIALIACNNNAHPEHVPVEKAEPAANREPVPVNIVNNVNTCGAGSGCKCCKKQCKCCCCGSWCTGCKPPEAEKKKPEELAEPIVEKGVKEEIPALLADDSYAIVVDYSISNNPPHADGKQNNYQLMLDMAMEHCKKEGNDNHVFYCFGDKPMRCTYAEAKQLRGSACTDIEPILKMLDEDGKKNLLICTDGKINRPYEEHAYNKVVICNGNGGDQEFTRKMAKMAKSCKVIPF